MTSIFSWEGRPASPSRWQAFVKDSKTLAETSCLPTLASLIGTSPSGWSGKTCPASCHQTEDGILAPSSGRWQNSGMGGPTESWTLSSSEWNHTGALCRSADGVSSLSDVLETGDVPQRYYLSAKACQGILRRAEKRGKELPLALRKALEHVAATGQKVIEDLTHGARVEAPIVKVHPY